MKKEKRNREWIAQKINGLNKIRKCDTKNTNVIFCNDKECNVLHISI